MEVKRGYKHTEVGLIPEDWENQILEELTVKVGSGITPTGGVKVYKSEGRPFLRSQNIGWGKLILDDIAYIDDITHESFLSTEIEIDDVFLNITGASIGRSAVADERVVLGNVNQHVCIIRPRRTTLHPQYLNYFLLTKYGQKQIESFQAGGNRQGLNFGQIKSFHVSLPPTIAEQTAIVAALSDADALIQTLEKFIFKKRAIKQGAMQELLTGKKRLQGFSHEGKYKETIIGVIPKDWGLSPVGDLLDFKNGLNKAKNFFGAGTPIINYMDVFKNPGLLISDIKGKVTVSHEEIRNYKVNQGDVFFTRTSETVEEIGMSTVMLEGIKNTVFSGFVLRGRPKSEKLSLNFKKYCFRSEIVRRQIVSTSSYTTRALTNGRLLSRVYLPYPSSIEEQTAISKVLSDMDAEITALETKLAKYKQIKQGMMQNLLTGRIRLI